LLASHQPHQMSNKSSKGVR